MTLNITSLCSFSFVWLFVTPWTLACQAPPAKNTGVGCYALLQGIFPTQELNPCLLSLLRLLHWHVDSLPLVPPGKCSKYVCAATSVVSDLCDPMNCNPPGSSVLGILQAKILEWVVMLSSRGSSLPRDQTWVFYVSCIGRQVLYH